jgi:phosphate uptake regulator
MKRKLIKQGGSGLVAYIPKKWIDEKKLKAGNEINIEEEAGDLIISAETLNEKKEITLDLREEDPLFIKIIINDFYRRGYDKMIINYSSDQQFKTITQTIKKYLLGFEVSEKSPNKTIIENITLPESEKQEVLLRRIFLIIDEMFELTLNAMKEEKYTNYEEIIESKNKIGQYDNFSRRNISKKKFYQESSSFYWMLYNHLYLVSHSLTHLYETLEKNKTKLPKNFLELFIKIREFHNLIYGGFFKKDLATLKRINPKMNSFLYEEIHKNLEKSKGKDSIILYYFGELIRLLYKTNTPILGILLSNKTIN